MRKGRCDQVAISGKVAWTVAWLTTCSALASATPAWAQAAAAEPAQVDERSAPPDAEPATAEAGDILVTGSRIKRNGYGSPSPETVLSAAEIEDRAPTNIANIVNLLPQAAASATPRTNTLNVNAGSAGANFLNLRGMGATRTLVLLDGRRIVGSSVDGLVDVNTLPQTLISRIDVVTGGASAAYGSDAVSGVVNFILDKEFTGIRALAQLGVTGEGDGANRRFDLAAGTSFAGGRGHILASVNYTDDDGVLNTFTRSWYRKQKIVANPAFVVGNGQPTQAKFENVNISTAAPGGLITQGALRGTVFGPGGTPSAFVFGTLAGNLMIGGTPNDLLASNYALSTPVEQVTAFSRASFEFSDAFKVYGEFNYGRALAEPGSPFNTFFNRLTLQRDNAFLPNNLRSVLVAAGQPTFRLGTHNFDIGRYQTKIKRELQRYVLGAEGDLGGGWSYEAYGTYGRSDVTTEAGANVITARYLQAIDAVRNQAGQIVCRSTLSNPGNGCVPFNPLGIGVNSAEAIGYVTGVSRLGSRLEQRVAAASVQGEPFSSWAGPIAIVAGAEYRKESVTGTSDALSLTNSFEVGNYKPTIGRYSIYEFFGEVAVPLLRDSALGKRLDLDAAIRQTHYSNSGSVTTWKVGGSYSPFDGLRFRATRSRDIRAPNLSDLFLGGTGSNNVSVRDPVTNTNPVFNTVTSGNPNLQPEIANTFTGGVVYSPSWLSGFNASVDYFDIKVKDAIVAQTAQQIVDRCTSGDQSACGPVTRTNNVITFINLSPQNLAVERERGLDIEASYRTTLGADTRLQLRVIATHLFTRYLDDGISINRLDGENTGTLPKWRVVSSAALESGPFRVQFTGRSISSGVYDREFTPAILADNNIPGATYVDMAFQAKVPVGGNGEGEFFVNVDNLFDKDPVIVESLTSPQGVAPVNASLYDTLGRELRVGFRIKL